jgi:hypothetical protein
MMGVCLCGTLRFLFSNSQYDTACSIVSSPRGVAYSKINSSQRTLIRSASHGRHISAISHHRWRDRYTLETDRGRRESIGRTRSERLRAEVVLLRQGEAVAFTVNHRPTKSASGQRALIFATVLFPAFRTPQHARHHLSRREVAPTVYRSRKQDIERRNLGTSICRCSAKNHRFENKDRSLERPSEK